MAEADRLAIEEFGIELLQMMEHVRPLYLADIGMPDALWREMGIESGEPFRHGRVVEVV